MKIISIKGRNLASLEGDFSIDFTAPPLRNAGIYAITGPTGSGKSTVFDALCLALYGRTPRQKAAKENTVKVRDGKDSTLSQGDPRLIMRKGCADAMAEVSFVAMDTYSYTARWSVKRARNNPGGQMQEPIMELLDKETGRQFAGKKTEILKEIERLTGMTFDQFTRSVLLAQGDFTAFLKADQNEKAELLEKLTGTEIYSRISMLVYQKAKDAILKAKTLESRLNDLKLLEPEMIDELSIQLEALKTQQKKLNDQKQLYLQAIDRQLLTVRLQQGLEEARSNLQQAEQNLKVAAGRKYMLHLTEQAQEARSIYTAKINAAQSLGDRSTELTNARNSLLELSKEIETNKKQLAEAEKLHQTASETYTNARPIIARARELDTLISSKKEPFKQATKALEAAQAKVQEQLKECEAGSQRLDQLTRTGEELNAWLQQNESRRPVADNAPAISARLKEAERDLRQLNYYTNVADTTANKINDTTKEIEVLEATLLALTDRLAPLQENNRKNELLLKKVDKEKLEQEIDSSQRLQEHLTASWSLLEELTENKNTINRLQTELEVNEKKIEEAGIQLEDINRRLPIATAKKELTDKLLSAAKQRVTENIEQLRHTLNDGEPCPVCGSRQHPYASGKEVLYSEVDHLEKEAKECTDEWIALLNSKTSITEALKHLEEENQRLNLETGISESILETQQKKWTLLQQQEPELVLDEELQQLQERVAVNKIRIEDLNRQNLEIRNLMKDRDALNTEIALLKEEITHTTNELTALRSSQKLTQQELVTAQTAMASHKDNMTAIEEELSPWFMKQGWFEAWKTGTEGFINDLLQFTGQWNNKTAEWQRTEQLVLHLKTEITGMQKSLTEKKQDAEAKTKTLLRLKVESDLLMNERAKYFEGKEVALAEKEFAEAETNARNAQDEIRKQYERLMRLLKTREGVIEQLCGDVEKMQADLQQKTEELNNWLISFNNKNQKQGSEEQVIQADEAMLKEWLKVSASGIRQEREALKQLENELLKTRATCTEREQQLKTHLAENASPLTLEELQQEKMKVDETLESTTALLADILVTLKQDGLNRINARYLLSEKEALEAVGSRWQQLDQVIGSADGRKFRQIAQKYTLEVLLGFANKHLSDLSPRYSLELVPDSLALQVVDHDMGDEIRSVHYLSGGESFLVSLALALALASLSSSRMKVESLFIDEGFGSLDPDTLSTAMDALEKLRNTGRKVGVISHVQEMTERIPVQIRIVKGSGGKSKVLVTG